MSDETTNEALADDVDVVQQCPGCDGSGCLRGFDGTIDCVVCDATGVLAATCKVKTLEEWQNEATYKYSVEDTWFVDLNGEEYRIANVNNDSPPTLRAGYRTNDSARKFRKGRRSVFASGVSFMQRCVETFMRAFKQEVPRRPTLERYPFELRARLIFEEALEFVHACGYKVAVKDSIVRFTNEKDGIPDGIPLHGWKLVRVGPPDWVKMIDAAIDLLYVSFGALSAMGVRAEPYFAEVHRSNMEKTGGPVDEFGKQRKPENWTPPDIKGVLTGDILAHDMTEEVRASRTAAEGGDQ